MPIAELHTLCAIKIDTTVIGQIVNQELSDDLQELLTGDSGDVYNRDAGVGSEDIRIRLTTQAVKTALATVGLTGKAVLTGHTVILYFQQYDAGGTRKTAGYTTVTIGNGIVVWRGLNASGPALADVSLEVVAISADGTTAPFILAINQAGPTIPATQEMYVLGGTAGIQSFSIDPGIGLQVLGSDGEVYRTFVAVEGIQPVVTVRKTAMGTLGSAATAIGSVLLNNVLTGGLRGTSPITFTFNQKMTTGRSIGGRPALTEYRVTPTFNGTLAPIVITGIT